MSEHQRRALVRILRDEVAHTADRERLPLRARHWLYEHRLIIVHERAIRALVAAALADLEAATAAFIRATVSATALKQWAAAAATRPDGPAPPELAVSAPAKHPRARSPKCSSASPSQRPGPDRHLGELNDALVRRYARRMATRPPSISERIKEPARTVEMALLPALLPADGHRPVHPHVPAPRRRSLAPMRRRRRLAIDWSRQYQLLLQELAELAQDG